MELNYERKKNSYDVDSLANIFWTRRPGFVIPSSSEERKKPQDNFVLGELFPGTE